MRFTDFETFDRRSGACNFTFLLEALEKLHPDDEALTEQLRKLDWEEPLHIVKRFTLGRSSRTEATTERVSPMTALIRLNNPRLSSAGIRQDMIPEQQTVFHDERHMSWTYNREGFWRKEINEAFAIGDWRSAEKMIPWCGRSNYEPLFAKDWDRTPLSALLNFNSRVNQKDVEKCIQLALATAAEEFEASPNKGRAPKREAAEHAQKTLDSMLQNAASHTNEPLCQTLLKMGARHTRSSLLPAFTHGLFPLFWSGLEAIRSKPKTFAKASNELSECDDERPAISPVLGSLCSSIASGVESALESIDFHGDGISYEFSCFDKHKEKTRQQLGKILDDGLAFPGLSADELAKDRIEALISLTPAIPALDRDLTQDGSESLAACLDRLFPEPDPEELGALLMSGQNERFKSRCAVSQASLASGFWTEKSAVKLADAVTEALNQAARSRGNRETKAQDQQMEALSLLAWLAAKAPDLLPANRGAQALLSESRLGTSDNLAQYTLRMESEMLDMVMERGSAKSPRPRKA